MNTDTKRQNTHIDTNKYIHTLTYIHTFTYIHTLTYIHTHTLTYIHTHTLTYIHTHTQRKRERKREKTSIVIILWPQKTYFSFFSLI
jgi:hypothetical protein